MSAEQWSKSKTLNIIRFKKDLKLRINSQIDHVQYFKKLLVFFLHYVTDYDVSLTF